MQTNLVLQESSDYQLYTDTQAAISQFVSQHVCLCRLRYVRPKLLSKLRKLAVVYTLRYAVMTWCLVQDTNNFTCSQMTTHDDYAGLLTN